ncbi:MAG: hypothetical protein ACE5DX_06055 [Candidatus Dojkabacteria bacterium]
MGNIYILQLLRARQSSNQAQYGALLGDLISRLDEHNDGMLTYIGPRGVKISGGER